MMKASAAANSNIALVKYWGKRDDKLILPYNSSISMTLDKMTTKTTVEFDNKYKEDIFILNNNKLNKNSEDYKEYIEKFLNIIREEFKIKQNVKIKTENNFPTSAGLASSASGFAALSLAVNSALNLGLDKKELSILARRGSGSASRSIPSGFVEWKKGKRKDGKDSYAETIRDENHWKELRLIACVTSKKEKKIKSRAGMSQSVKTSPIYKSSWLSSIEDDLKKTRKAIIEKDFSLLGKTAQENCLKMHAVMLTTNPPIIYINDKTKEIIYKIDEINKKGIECYFTMDAGPQLKIICLEKDAKKIISECRKIKGIKEIYELKCGKSAYLTEEHLF